MAENDFQMTPVVSSQIQEVGFNSATKQGRVRFLAKRNSPSTLYEYDNCTQDEFDAIRTGAISESVGITFGQVWKGTKPYRKLE